MDNVLIALITLVLRCWLIVPPLVWAGIDYKKAWPIALGIAVAMEIRSGIGEKS